MTIPYDDPRVLRFRQEEQDATKKVRRYETALLAILAKRTPEEGPPGLTEGLALRYVEMVEAFEKKAFGDLPQRFEALLAEATFNEGRSAAAALKLEATPANPNGVPVPPPS